MSFQDPAQGVNNRVRILLNSTYLVSTEAGDILVNSPPETLKYLLSQGLKAPEIILISPDVPPGQQLGSCGFVRQGINYASVEFLIFSNFFGAGERRTRLITVTDEQAMRLRRLLTETICGPLDPAAYEPYRWLHRECAAISHYPPFGRDLELDDLVMISSLESGAGVFGPVQIRIEGDHFIFSEHGVDVATVSTEITQTPLPFMMAPPRPLVRQELTLQFIGASDGFDPGGITTCFLAYLGTTPQTRPTLFDAAAYLRVRLGYLGISPSQISEVVLSHLHEDHLAGLPELVLMGGHRVRLVTSTLIYQGLLRVLSAMMAVSESEVASLFDYYPLDPGCPLELEGRLFEAIYAVHSIPTIAVRVQSLCYSGDMRYDETWFADLEATGVLSAARRDELLQFAKGASVLVQDVGGGAIHTTLTPEVLDALVNKSQRLILAHTSKHLLPEARPDLAERVEFADSGHVFAIGAAVPSREYTERLESLSACTFFVRLPITDRIDLAKRAELQEWPDGAVVIQEGDPSNGCAYVVHSGLVEVWVKQRLVQVLGRGSSVGERGALQGYLRTSTIIARGQLQLLSLNAEIFCPVAERLGLLDAFTRADWLWRQRAFAHLPWGTLLDLALDFQVRQVAPGEQLFAVGEMGYEAYLLVSGAIVLLDREGRQVEELNQPGELFGARASLYGALRETTAHARQQSEVWALSSPALKRFHMVYPNMLLHLRTIPHAGS